MTDNVRPVALVTGGSRGIGRACVERLAADGYNVGFCYASDAAAAESVAIAVKEHGGQSFAKQADVSDAAAMREFVSETEAALGPVTTVVTSAGITKDNPLLLMADEAWEKVLRVNLDGTYNACRAVVFEMMKRRKGSIITISSVAGVYGNATQTNYAASKAGIIGFTKSLAKEVGRYGIRANVVAPGFIETDMTAELSEKVLERANEQIPLQRLGSAADVADMVSFLASEQAAYVTGSVMHVDGGIHL